MELLEHRTRLDAQLRVEVRERLVHQEDGGLTRDRSADGDALPLPAGELFRLALEQLADAEHLRGLVHSPLDLRLGHTPELQTERDVVVHAHVRVERVVLEDHRDVAVLRRNIVHHALADADVAGRLLLEAREHSERRRLAAARGSNQDEKLGIADRQVEVVHRNEVAEPLGDVVAGYGSHLAASMSQPGPAGTSPVSALGVPACRGPHGSSRVGGTRAGHRYGADSVTVTASAAESASGVRKRASTRTR